MELQCLDKLFPLPSNTPVLKSKNTIFFQLLNPLALTFKFHPFQQATEIPVNFFHDYNRQKKYLKKKKLYLECSGGTLEAKIPLSALGRRVKWQRSEVHLPLRERRGEDHSQDGRPTTL